MKLNVGLVIDYKATPHKVVAFDSETRTLSLQKWGGSVEKVNEGNPGLKNPVLVSQWPFLNAPKRNYRAVKLTRCVQRRIVELIPFKEWSPTDVFCSGGPIFLNPALKLKLGEVLVLHYKNGPPTCLRINRNFASVFQRKARQKAKTEKPKGLFDFLKDE